MKDYQLLDAIGGIDESILTEAETAPVQRKKAVPRLLLIAAIICLLGVTVYAATELLSRPILGSDIVTGETVFPFSMDAAGNIIMEGVSGLKVTMDVEVNPDAPDWIRELYVLDPGNGWVHKGGGSSGSRYEIATKFTTWEQPGKPGEIRLDQSVAEFYTNNIYGEQCVDTLPGLSEAHGVTARTVIIGDMDVLMVTIPALPNYTGTDYCQGGETRLYWTDGNYMLHLDYPYWVTDAQAEAMLRSLTRQTFIPATPEDFGTINPESIAQRLPDLSIGMDNGTTCANNVTGLGYAAYGDGCIYLAGNENSIYCYEIASGKLAELPLANQTYNPGHMMVTDQYILYTNVWEDLIALKKDGSTEEPVFEGVGSAQLYAEGTTLYTSQGILDLYTGKIQNWPEGVHSYFVDENYIYAVQEGDDYCYLRAVKGTMDFEQIPLSFRPVKVLSVDGALYMSRSGTWDVIRVREGKEEKLPVKALEYQVIGNLLIYRDEEANGRSLKSYHLQTGEIRELCDKAFTFSVLEERYLCVFCAYQTESYYTLIDLQTDTVTRIDIAN